MNAPSTAVTSSPGQDVAVCPRIDDYWDESAEEVAERMRRLLGSASALAEPVAYALAAGGKRIRCLVTTASASLDPRCVVPCAAATEAAAAIEAIHEATLVHDDILDDTTIRRDRLSAAAIFDVRTGFFAGAYIAGKGLSSIALLCERAGFHPEYDVFRDLAKAEALELLPASSDAACRERALRTIADGKTGVLFRLAARLGSELAVAAGARRLDSDRLDAFAVALGRAFQIRDDILDILGGANLRRPGTSDLARGLMSWPVHYWLESSSDAITDIARLKDAAVNAESVSRLAIEIVASNAITRTRGALRAQLDEARVHIDAFPHSRGQSALLHLIAWLGVA